VFDFIQQIFTIDRKHPVATVVVKVQAGIENFLLRNDAEIVICHRRFIAVGIADSGGHETPIADGLIVGEAQAVGQLGCAWNIVATNRRCRLP